VRLLLCVSVIVMQPTVLCTRHDSIDPIRIGDLGPLNVRYLDTAQLPRLAGSIEGLARRRGERIDRDCEERVYSLQFHFHPPLLSF